MADNLPKVNNDVLIPRSILKKSEVGPRDYAKMRLKDELPQLSDSEELEDFLAGKNVEHQISPREGVVGRKLDVAGPILSPRTFNQNYLENQYKKIELRE